MNGVTYDTDVLIAADRNDRRVRASHARFLALEVSPTVPDPGTGRNLARRAAPGEPRPPPRPTSATSPMPHEHDS
jgi:hypothetical protein